MKIESAQNSSEFDAVVQASDAALLGHTWRWGNVLERFTGAERHYLIARQNGVALGVLPAFLKRSRCGNVLNSLPFFGTHGGPLTSKFLVSTVAAVVKRELLLAFKALARELDCAFATVITSPFENDTAMFGGVLKPQYVDERVAQISVFPRRHGNAEQAILHGMVEKRCRNAVQKARASGVMVELAHDLDDVGRLVELHREGMLRVGGIVKPPSFFRILFEEYGALQNKAFRVYYARKDDNIIAALLVLCHGSTVDYYTPAFDLAYKQFQPLSLLVYEAMRDAYEMGYTFWNFGGGARLSGVYRFKQSWGATDWKYKYYTNAFDDATAIRSLSREQILKEYEWFYVLPFNYLNVNIEEARAMSQWSGMVRISRGMKRWMCQLETCERPLRLLSCGLAAWTQ